MLTKQAKATLASDLAVTWFDYTRARNPQEKQASAAEFIQKIANSNASMQEKQAWAAALSRALPWAAKGLMGLGRGVAKGRKLVGGALQGLGSGGKYMGKGLSQGVTPGGALARGGAARAAGGIRGAAGNLMQRGGAAASNTGKAMATKGQNFLKNPLSRNASMNSSVAGAQKALSGQVGRNINIGAGAAAGGAGLYGLGRASAGGGGTGFDPKNLTPEQTAAGWVMSPEMMMLQNAMKQGPQRYAGDPNKGPAIGGGGAKPGAGPRENMMGSGPGYNPSWQGKPGY